MLSQVILQAASPWKQQFLDQLVGEAPDVAILRCEALSLTDEIHTSRLPEWLNHRALALSVEASSNNQRGIGICLFVRGNRVLTSVAEHLEDSTSLNRWECSVDRVAQLFEQVRQQIAASSPSATSSGNFNHRHRTSSCSSSFDIDRYPVLTLDETRSWKPQEKSNIAAIYPGSFFPLHHGHRSMRVAAEQFLGGRVLFELTVRNADKAPLDHLSLETRVSQFAPDELVLTSAPRFDQKAELFPNCAFVVGFDTALRVLERRFYSQGELESALDRIAEQNCRFVVASRLIGSQLHTRDDLMIPAGYHELFDSLPDFLEDVSSSDIREAYWRGETDVGPVPIL